MKEKARSSGSVGWCEVHEKLLYTSRKLAKEAIRRLHGKGMTRYLCEAHEGARLWHIGHLPYSVRVGTISRQVINART
jgi:hypothetical protein